MKKPITERLCREYETDEVDVAAACYWWLTENHGGQGSREYSALSRLERVYSPGAMESSERLNPQALAMYTEMTAETAIAAAEEICGEQS